MTHERFKNLLEELDGTGAKVLSEKNARYSTSNDALQNFHEGAEIMGCTTAQACWGYMTKHLSALRKMIWSNDFSNREDVMEKIQDSLNYLRFLWVISEEEREKETEDEQTQTQEPSCIDCQFFSTPMEVEPCLGCKNTKTIGTEEYLQLPLNFKTLQQ